MRDTMFDRVNWKIDVVVTSSEKLQHERRE
jgi:hypothetical protein